jgi:hypothetical protein
MSQEVVILLPEGKHSDLDLWVVTPCSFVADTDRGTCYLLLHGHTSTLNMKAAYSSKSSVCPQYYMVA